MTLAAALDPAVFAAEMDDVFGPTATTQGMSGVVGQGFCCCVCNWCLNALLTDVQMMMMVMMIMMVMMMMMRFGVTSQEIAMTRHKRRHKVWTAARSWSGLCGFDMASLCLSFDSFPCRPTTCF